MKDLMYHFNECKKELDAIGIEYGLIVEIIPNSRAMGRWGQCKTVCNSEYWENRQFSININTCLLSDDVTDEALRNTIIHEILHTCRDCMNHGTEWKQLAEFVNDCYSCYNIKRTTSSEEKGISSEVRQGNYHYRMVCAKCGNEWFRHRKPKYSTYIHTNCGGKIVIKANR